MKSTLIGVLLLFYPFITLLSQTNRDLTKAIQEAKLPMVEKALKNGADVNYRIQRGRHQDMTPVMLAVIYNRDKILKRLIAAGGKVNDTIKTGKAKGFTPLMIALSAGKSYQCQKILIDAGADVNARLAEGELRGSTVLMFAVLYNHYRATKLLIASGAKINYIHEFSARYQSINRSTALDLAIETHNAKMIALVRELGGQKAEELEKSWWQLL